MRVKFLAETKVTIDKINSLTYPEGWEGEVQDTLGHNVVAQGLAAELVPTLRELPPGQQFTPEQAAVLAAAADHALEQARLQEPDAGEPEISLEDLKKDELLELALEKGIDGAKGMRKDELLEALKALQTAESDA